MNCDAGNINQFKGKQQNITVNKGDSFISIPFEFYSDDAYTIPIDITANTYEMIIRSGSSEKLVMTMVITSPNILTASTGRITLSETTYFYDLKQTTPDGRVSTYIYGDFRVINK